MEIWDEHKFIYHYTDLAGVKGIVESQCLHATHFSCLNDYTEMVGLKPALLDFVRGEVETTAHKLFNEDPSLEQKIQSEHPGEDIVDHHAELMVAPLFKNVLNNTFFDPYVASFCGHEKKFEQDNGLLSQWRGYGQEIGCAIVFDTEKLGDLLDEDTKQFNTSVTIFERVRYFGETDHFENIYSGFAELIRELVPNLIRRAVPEELTPELKILLNELLFYFVKTAPYHKHQGFSEENEVRLMVAPRRKVYHEAMQQLDPEKNGSWITDDVRRVYFRDDCSPYIKLFEAIDEVRLPITKIIVGPGRDNHLRGKRIEKLVEGMDIEVSCSATPLV